MVVESRPRKLFDTRVSLASGPRAYRDDRDGDVPRDGDAVLGAGSRDGGAPYRPAVGLAALRGHSFRCPPEDAAAR